MRELGWERWARHGAAEFLLFVSGALAAILRVVPSRSAIRYGILPRWLW